MTLTRTLFQLLEPSSSSSDARSARSGSFSCAAGTPKTATIASPMCFSTVPPHEAIDLGERLEADAQERVQPLGVEPLAELRRADHVGEQDRRELALGDRAQPRLGRNGRRPGSRSAPSVRRSARVKDPGSESVARAPAAPGPERFRAPHELLAPARRRARVRLPAAAVEREHQLSAQRSRNGCAATSVSSSEHELVVAAERQVGSRFAPRARSGAAPPGGRSLSARTARRAGPPAARRPRARAPRADSLDRLYRIVQLPRLRDQRLECARSTSSAERATDSRRSRPDPIGAD